MAIQCECRHCLSRFRVKDEFQGKRGKCPRCSKVIEVPIKESLVEGPGREISQKPKATVPTFEIPEPSRDEREQMEMLQSVFGEKITRVRAGFFYQVGLFLVTAFVLLLPLIYVGLIGLTGWGVYYHAVEHTGILKVGGGIRGRIFLLAVYVAPIFCGVILVFFMLKPLIARTVRDERRRTLRREGQPVLFEFVDRICESVRAPKPKRIDVVFDVNAYAGLRRGFLSFFSSDLVLTIGLPLVAGLSSQQLAGVLAHEFGHFTQRFAMRLGWCIHRVNQWFHRVVYERDEFDTWLSDSIEEHDSIIALLFMLAVACVGLTRFVLLLLMIISHAASCMLSRQMEFDADQHEARLVGSETFKQTCHQLPYLVVAFQHALISLLEGDLPPGKIPRYVGNYVKNMSMEDKQEIRKQEKQRRSNWFDTHPTNEIRIERASTPKHPGIIELEGPAKDLFRNFDQICESAAKG